MRRTVARGVLGVLSIGDLAGDFLGLVLLIAFYPASGSVQLKAMQQAQPLSVGWTGSRFLKNCVCSEL